jgi:hypothetical protein
VNALIRAAADLQAVCEANQWRFCFIGGLAVLRWGEPRETIDVDLTLITGFGRERAFASVLLESRGSSSGNHIGWIGRTCARNSHRCWSRRTRRNCSIGSNACAITSTADRVGGHDSRPSCRRRATMTVGVHQPWPKT